MKHVVSIILALGSIIPCAGQKGSDSYLRSEPAFSVFSGYHKTTIFFNDAHQWPLNWNQSKRFFGMTGFNFGVGREFGSRTYVDLSFSEFSGQGIRDGVDPSEYAYSLNGFQIPVIINFLVRDRQKKFNINFGAGIQYINANLKQYEGTTTTPLVQLNDIKVSEIQLGWNVGVRLRVFRGLDANATLNISVAGRLTIANGIALRYTFEKHSQPAK